MIKRYEYNFKVLKVKAYYLFNSGGFINLNNINKILLTGIFQMWLKIKNCFQNVDVNNFSKIIRHYLFS